MDRAGSDPECPSAEEVRAGRNGGRETKVALWIPPRYFAAASGRQSAGAFTPR
ncbi:MAG: hypothetical protein RLY70_3985, partial [Planctomycetota bacterium]